MLVHLKSGIQNSEINQLKTKINQAGLKVFQNRAGSNLAVLGDLNQSVLNTNIVKSFITKHKDYLLVSREFETQTSLSFADNTSFNFKDLLVIAGPCSVESSEQLELIAQALVKTGVKFIRGGAYKPRTSPYSFQGLAAKGLALMAKVAAKYGLKIVSEIMDPRDLDLFLEYVDVIQIGTRNMMNYRLLKELGRINRPILLKRGMSATLKEWLLSAEHIASEGNLEIILCERGIRSFDSETRNILDLSCIPILKELTHLPVIIDPSHATGKSALVPAMSKAAIAAGANGLLIEVHPNPKMALSDGEQSLSIDEYLKTIDEIQKLHQFITSA